MDERVKQAFEELAEGEAEVVEQVWNLVIAIDHSSEQAVIQQHNAIKAATTILVAFSSSAYEAIGAAEIVKQTLMDYLEHLNEERRRKHE